MVSVRVQKWSGALESSVLPQEERFPARRAVAQPLSPAEGPASFIEAPALLSWGDPFCYKFLES